MQGTVSLRAAADGKKRAEQFGTWSKTAYACSPSTGEASRAARGPRGGPSGEARRCLADQHVIFVIPRIALRSSIRATSQRARRAATVPLRRNCHANAHALAREFGALRQFLPMRSQRRPATNGRWAPTRPISSERMWPFQLRTPRKQKYGLPGRRSFPRVAFPANGYLWNRAAEAGVSYRATPNSPQPAKCGGDVLAEPSLAILGATSTFTTIVDLGYPDVKRADDSSPSCTG